MAGHDSMSPEEKLRALEEERQRSGNWIQMGGTLVELRELTLEILDAGRELLLPGTHWQHWPLQPATPQVFEQLIDCPAGHAIFTCSQASPCSRSEQRLPTGHAVNGIELLLRAALEELAGRDELLRGTHWQHWPLQPATPHVLLQLMV